MWEKCFLPAFDALAKGDRNNARSTSSPLLSLRETMSAKAVCFVSEFKIRTNQVLLVFRVEKWILILFSFSRAIWPEKSCPCARNRILLSIHHFSIKTNKILQHRIIFERLMTKLFVLATDSGRGVSMTPTLTFLENKNYRTFNQNFETLSGFWGDVLDIHPRIDSISGFRIYFSPKTLQKNIKQVLNEIRATSSLVRLICTSVVVVISSIPPLETGTARPVFG